VEAGYKGEGFAALGIEGVGAAELFCFSYPSRMEMLDLADVVLCWCYLKIDDVYGISLNYVGCRPMFSRVGPFLLPLET
jgi:hypothetical protein